VTAAPAAAPREPVLADIGNRVIASVLDVLLLIFLMTGLRTVMPAGQPSNLLVWSIALAYLCAFPLTPLRGTPGKAVARIRLARLDGRPLDWHRSLVRGGATLGWIWLGIELGRLRPEADLGHAITAGWITFFLAWAVMGLTPRGQSLFDLAAGSMVVRASASPEAVAQYQPLRHSVVEMGSVVVGCALFGLFFENFTRIAYERNLRGRVGYALEATEPLRDKIKAFHLREGRWPSAAELGVADSTSYRDGGYYRLQGDGVVQIGFTVLPELQGRTITLRPRPLVKGFDWHCSADVRLAPKYLPGNCRPN
jgi:uncharacterized RDD family membrane protein YckC